MGPGCFFFRVSFVIFFLYLKPRNEVDEVRIFLLFVSHHEYNG